MILIDTTHRRLGRVPVLEGLKGLKGGEGGSIGSKRRGTAVVEVADDGLAGRGSDWGYGLSAAVATNEQLLTDDDEAHILQHLIL